MFMNIYTLSPRAVRVHEYLYAVTRSSTCSWISLCCHQEQYVFMDISMLPPGAIHVHEYLLCCHQEQYVFMNISMLSPVAVRVHEYLYAVTRTSVCS